MKQFDEWYAKECEDLDPDFVGWTGEAMRDAFRAGMLAAADIADKYAFDIQSKDSGDYAIGNNIGAKIRDACKDEG